MEVTLLPQQHHLQAEANLEEETSEVEIQQLVQLVQQLLLQLQQGFHLLWVAGLLRKRQGIFYSQSIKTFVNLSFFSDSGKSATNI